jgi:hypothetical protein
MTTLIQIPNEIDNDDIKEPEQENEPLLTTNKADDPPIEQNKENQTTSEYIYNI